MFYRSYGWKHWMLILRNFCKFLEFLQLSWMGCRSFTTAHKRKIGCIYNLSTVLNCRSEQMFRGKWQRRKCQVSRGCLEIFHSDTSKAPNRVELVTCDMKSVQDDRLCFDVFSFNRTYHFQVSWHTQKLQKTKTTLHDFFLLLHGRGCSWCN